MARVVVIENDNDIGPLIVQLLALGGHEPVLVSEPSKTMSVIRAHRPSLVYLDVRLTEEIDGFTVLRQIRAESDVPVLMSSGMDLEQECLKAGADAFLLKPFDFNDLLNGMQRAWNSRRGDTMKR